MLKRFYHKYIIQRIAQPATLFLDFLSFEIGETLITVELTGRTTALEKDG